MDEEQQRRIEETVLQILKVSDLETATEFSVRAAAAERLGFQLSGLAVRRLVQQLIDSFLLSNAASILGTTKDYEIGLTGERSRNPQHPTTGGVGVQGNGRGGVICKLSEKRWVTIHDLHGTTMVAIRDFFLKDGNMLPSKASDGGINLPMSQWTSFRNSFSAIEEAIVKLESRLRGRHAVHQLNNPNCESEAIREADLTKSGANSIADKSQAGAGISHLTDTVKRKRPESEAELASAVADSTTENSRIDTCISYSAKIAQPHIKRSQTEADTSPSANALNSEEHVHAERKHEETGASGSIVALESQENATAERKQTEAQTSLPLATCHALGQVHGTANEVHPDQPTPVELKETESDFSTAVPAFPTYGKLLPERLIPMLTARFDGRNFHSWRHQMEIFLNQLNIAHVLTEPCPRTYSNLEANFNEKVRVQRWIVDDYLCHHHILNSLCDSLCQIYSQKVQSARELWEQLNVAYNEDFGTKRSQINKYIHFQMVDGVPIVDQVNELHKIANSIIASGTWIDENFHVSTIISMLPPSWKEFRVRLMMQEEFVPCDVLVHRLQAEEESRDGHKKEYKSGHATEPRVDCRLGIRKRDNKRVCYYCGKEGHMIRNCPTRKFDGSTRSNGKEHDGVSSSCMGDKIVEAAPNTE